MNFNFIKMKTTENITKTNPEHSFSLDKLNEIGNNDKTFRIEMLNQFLSLARESSEKMLSALKQNDLVKLKQAAHKGVPSYAILDLSDIVNMLKTIENDIIKDGNVDSVRAIVELFDQKNTIIIKEIEIYLKE